MQFGAQGRERPLEALDVGRFQFERHPHGSSMGGAPRRRMVRKSLAVARRAIMTG